MSTFCCHSGGRVHDRGPADLQCGPHYQGGARTDTPPLRYHAQQDRGGSGDVGEVRSSSEPAGHPPQQSATPGSHVWEPSSGESCCLSVLSLVL